MEVQRTKLLAACLGENPEVEREFLQSIRGLTAMSKNNETAKQSLNLVFEEYRRYRRMCCFTRFCIPFLLLLALVGFFMRGAL